MKIYPYKMKGLWMFDDVSIGVYEEILFTNLLIERATKQEKIKEPEKGFCLTFESEPFEGYQYDLLWKQADGNGNTYYCPELNAEGWLCPVLLKYFDQAPQHIYVRVENGQNPTRKGDC